MLAPRCDRPAARRRLLLAAAAVSGLPGRGLRAQSARPLHILVPFTPGGSSDILARALAPPLATALGMPVIVENKPGAGGTLAADLVARSEPDGLTLLMGHTGTLAVNPSLYPRLPYDPDRALRAVAYVARVPNVLVVGAGSSLRTLGDLLAAARAQPDRLTFSSGGNGSAAHLTFESLKLRAGIVMRHVPYRGTAPSVTDVIAGHVDCTFTGSPAVIGALKGGRLRALAVSSAQRLPVLPDVPTVAESGFAGFEADQWYGLVAPAAAPDAWVMRLNDLVGRIVQRADIAQQFATEGAVAMPMGVQAFAELIARDRARWAEVVRAGRVTVE